MKRIFFGIAVALCAYEVYALLNRDPDDTISEMTWCANRRPIVPFLAGVLAGHLFRQSDNKKETGWTGNSPQA